MYASRNFQAEECATRWKTSATSHRVYGETAAPEIKEINWLLEHYRKHFRLGCKAALPASTTSPAILQGVETGMGIGVLPDYVAIGHPELVQVLPEVPAPSFDVHLVYADALRQSKRVAAFGDFLVKGSKDWQY